MRAALRQEVEREIADAGVRVNSAEVLRSGVAVRIIVFGRAVQRRVIHIARRVARHARRVDVLSDFPGVGALPADKGLGRGAEDVRHRFVQCAGLVRVCEVGGGLRHTVSHFVRHDVETARKPGECRAVPIAEVELTTVPVRVGVADAIMNGGDQSAATAVP